MYQTSPHPDAARTRAASAHAQDTPARAASAPEGYASAAEDARTDGARLHVLVVDDAPDVTEMLALLMSYAGFRVTTAFSGPEAFDAARDGRFDAVISDIGMPGMNGYQLAEALRALPGYERTPLIAVTGFTQYDDRERARRAGFDGFFTKPINPSDLIDAVKRLCG